VHVAENCKDKKVILRIGSLRNRVLDLWLGAVRAQKGDVLTNEKRIRELFSRYGRDTIKGFVEGWLPYCGPANGGPITLDSVEVSESMCPFIIALCEVDAVSQGDYEFQAATGMRGSY
jgi:hypothetical protein